VLLFASRRAIESHAGFQKERSVNRPLSVVHPGLYLTQIQEARQAAQAHQQLRDTLGEGGTFEVQRTPDGGLRVRKIAAG